MRQKHQRRPLLKDQWGRVKLLQDCIDFTLVRHRNGVEEKRQAPMWNARWLGAQKQKWEKRVSCLLLLRCGHLHHLCRWFCLECHRASFPWECEGFTSCAWWYAFFSKKNEMHEKSRYRRKSIFVKTRIRNWFQSRISDFTLDIQSHPNGKLPDGRYTGLLWQKLNNWNE